jgi:simple sugar transport system permease protein
MGSTRTESSKLRGQGDAPRSQAAQPGPMALRSAQRHLLVRIAARPEASAAVGAIVVFAYFAIAAGDNGFLSSTGTSNYLEVAAQIGIIACAAGLLMIAGEYDLSVGSMTGAGGIAVAYPLVHLDWPLWVALAFGLAIACVVGLIQGLIVLKTKLPSFIVTLAGLYVISGLNLELTRSLTDATSVDGVTAASNGDFLARLFTGEVFGLPVVVAWWLGLTLLAMWGLNRTRFGNWIYACGGDRESARRAGVPVARVKVTLFVCVAISATLVGALMMFTIDSANVNAGNGFEFQTITAAVIGGTLITGGFGSPIGVAFGALIYGMVNQGFFFTDISGDLVTVFLGAMLLLAVLVNHYARAYSLRRLGNGV